MKRKIYLDNIRWTTVVLVMIYHVIYIFNNLGVPGGLGPITKAAWPNALLYFVYPWFMVLLFTVSGMCSWYELKSNPDLKAFTKKRTIRLLLPATAGLFVFQWIGGLFNLMNAGSLQLMPKAILYPIAALSGTGPLWFIQELWLNDMILALLVKLGFNRFRERFSRPSWLLWILFGLGLWGSSFVLNAPVITVYRFGIYLWAFLFGYFYFSHADVISFLQKFAVVLSAAACVCGIGYTWYYWGQDYTSSAVLESFFTNLYCTLAVLAVLGGFKAWADRTNRFCSWMSQNSYGLYIVHYMCLLIPCYYLKQTALPAGLIYLLALLSVFGISPIVYEILRRIPVVRLLVLGITRPKKAG